MKNKSLLACKELDLNVLSALMTLGILGDRCPAAEFLHEEFTRHQCQDQLVDVLMLYANDLAVHRHFTDSLRCNMLRMAHLAKLGVEPAVLNDDIENSGTLGKVESAGERTPFKDSMDPNPNRLVDAVFSHDVLCWWLLHHSHHPALAAIQPPEIAAVRTPSGREFFNVIDGEHATVHAEWYSASCAAKTAWLKSLPPLLPSTLLRNGKHISEYVCFQG